MTRTNSTTWWWSGRDGAHWIAASALSVLLSGVVAAAEVTNRVGQPRFVGVSHTIIHFAATTLSAESARASHPSIPQADPQPATTQDPKKQPGETLPATPPAERSSGASKAPPKSLDELIGVPSTRPTATSGSESSSEVSSDRSAEDAAERAERKRLERSLDEASMQDLVDRALESMKSASARLTDAKDPGLGTQRIQEDVIKSLDRLLEEATKQQKKGSGSSSRSKSSKSQQSKSGDPSEQNGQQSGDAKGQASKGAGDAESGTATASPSDGETPSTAPANDASVAGTELSESRIEWGQLPARVRELVLQGRRDKVSTLYERLTREYYRRLAEEASK